MNPRRTTMLLLVTALLACSKGREPDRKPPSAPAAVDESCIETAPLIKDDEAKAVLGGLSGPGRCHTCAQARGVGSGCAWQGDGRAGMPRMLNAGVSIYQSGNTWETTRAIRLQSGTYRDVPGLPGQAHAAVIVGQLQLIMRLGDRGELMLMMPATSAGVDIPEAFGKLARTFYARAIAN